ncbi:glycosyltransferase family 2 protein [Gramella sp. GC03-9]|uniref:Glycosyltransferase family 2 protein n=1 Tax=Christiangramia oceanisediminis TaxID=2920386 RepID=A0A9X2KVD2_9FLAO|nr:glycosyltransferase family 2 protein [Gramella oceanisediminis]MCP9198313.1 glycosyltransferase family 2 protein [Gramella oceanisediminis]
MDLKMKNLYPTVSIIIPTFNRRERLVETLKSLKLQIFKNWECLVIDDENSMQTRMLLDGFSKNDSRFKYFNRPIELKKGAASCRNFGFQKSKGNYIQWLDDDDFLSNNKLHLQVRILEKIKDQLTVATCPWDLFWPKKKLEPKSPFPGEGFFTVQSVFERITEKKTFLPLHTYLIPKNIIRIAGLWNSSLTLNDDAEFMCRVLVNSQNVFNTDGCYAFYGEHSGVRISSNFTNISIKSNILSLRLMKATLEFNDIFVDAFFQWKAMNLYVQCDRVDKSLIEKYKNFFMENGIRVDLKFYLNTKIYLYKRVKPILKRIGL